MITPPRHSSSDTAIDDAIAVWLRDGAPARAVFDFDRDRLFFRIDLNGVGPLLALQSDLAQLPDDLAQHLRQMLLAREMWEEQHKRVLQTALEALVGAGLTPLVMKGTALAWSRFPRPAARIRSDSDVLIEQDGRTRAFEALEAVGFTRPMRIGGAVSASEALFQKPDLAGAIHDLDLHWRLNSSPVLANLLSHQELVSRACPMPGLHPGALRLGDVDALLYAAVHRQLHLIKGRPIHLNQRNFPAFDRLIWLVDIHLLHQALDPADQQNLVQTAIEKGIADILADALRRSRDRLGTKLDNDLLDRLDATGNGAVSKYIAASPLRSLTKDLAATPGLRNKATYLRELLLPPAPYMHRHFATGRMDWLPILHIRRIVPGLKKLMHPGSARS